MRRRVAAQIRSARSSAVHVGHADRSSSARSNGVAGGRPRAARSARRPRRRPRRRASATRASCSLEDQPVGGVVVDDEHPQAGQPLGACASAAPARSRPALKRQREPEGAALARVRSRRRCRRPSAPRAARQMARPEPGAAVLARGRGVGLGERLEEPLDVVGAMPMPVSVTSTRSDDASPACRRSAVAPDARPRRRSVNFTALRRQVEQHLPRGGSGRRAGARARRGGSRPSSSRPLARAVSASRLGASARRPSRRSKSTASSSSLPASILEKSRMSLMTPSSASAGACDAVGVAGAARRRASVRSSSSVRPITPLSGRADLVAHRGQELRLRREASIAASRARGELALGAARARRPAPAGRPPARPSR